MGYAASEDHLLLGAIVRRERKMKLTYRDATVLGLISTLATAPAFSQVPQQPGNQSYWGVMPASPSPGVSTGRALGAAGAAVGGKTGQALEALGQSLTPPPNPPPAYGAQPYAYGGQPAAPPPPYGAQPYAYGSQPAAPPPPYGAQPYAYGGQPGAPASPYAAQ